LEQILRRGIDPVDNQYNINPFPVGAHERMFEIHTDRVVEGMVVYVIVRHTHTQSGEAMNAPFCGIVGPMYNKKVLERRFTPIPTQNENNDTII
jgi:hypothetical protein